MGKQTLFSVAVAAFLWFLMFSPWTSEWVNFWTMMSCSAAILITLSFCFRKNSWKEDIRFDLPNVLGGVVLALFLWGVFWVGDKVAAWMFDFARPQVELIYGMKDGENPWHLILLLLLLIGPAEEIFWRGYIQKRLSNRWNPNVGLVVTTLIYALVHIWSFNFMLIMAALVVGAAWGLAYRLFPKNLGAILISHALWDVAVFVLFPI